jgi:acyl carrier protein
MTQTQQVPVVAVPENIAGTTTTLSKLRSEIDALRYSIGDVLQDRVVSAQRVHALADIGLSVIQRRVEDAAREIDALRVQLAEARGLLVPRHQVRAVGIRHGHPVNFDGQFASLLKSHTDNPIVTGDEHYQNDLGMDSLEALEFLMMMIEDVYGIEISEADTDWLKTPYQLAKYLLKTHNINVYSQTNQ